MQIAVGAKALWATQEEAEQFLVMNGDSGRMRPYRRPIYGYHVGRPPSHLRTEPTTVPAGPDHLGCRDFLSGETVPKSLTISLSEFSCEAAISNLRERASLGWRPAV